MVNISELLPLQIAFWPTDCPSMNLANAPPPHSCTLLHLNKILSESLITIIEYRRSFGDGKQMWPAVVLTTRVERNIVLFGLGKAAEKPKKRRCWRAQTNNKRPTAARGEGKGGRNFMPHKYVADFIVRGGSTKCRILHFNSARKSHIKHCDPLLADAVLSREPTTTKHAVRHVCRALVVS